MERAREHGIFVLSQSDRRAFDIEGAQASRAFAVLKYLPKIFRLFTSYIYLLISRKQLWDMMKPQYLLQSSMGKTQSHFCGSTPYCRWLWILALVHNSGRDHSSPLCFAIYGSESGTFVEIHICVASMRHAGNHWGRIYRFVFKYIMDLFSSVLGVSGCLRDPGWGEGGWRVSEFTRNLVLKIIMPVCWGVICIWLFFFRGPFSFFYYVFVLYGPCVACAGHKNKN